MGRDRLMGEVALPRAVSVVVPAHNPGDALRTQLEALGPQIESWPALAEVVVVANRCSDETVETVSRLGAERPWLRLIEVNDRAGPSVARNRGVAVASAEILAFCDADDVVGNDWLEQIVSTLDRFPIATGRLEVETVNRAHLAQSRGRGSAGAPWFYGLFPVVAAGNCAMTVAAWTRLGGYDESLTHCEDMDLGLRAAISGLSIGYNPRAVVHYRYRNESRALFRQGFKYGQGRVRVAKRANDLGLGRPPRFGGWRSWAWLIARLPVLIRPEVRPGYSWVLGNRLGQLVASVQCGQLLL